MERTREINDIVLKTLKPLGFEGLVEVEKKDRSIFVNVQTHDAGTLIGRRGENLRALQHLLLLIVSKEIDYSFGPGEFSFDVNNYKKERENHLVSVAKNIAYEVKETKHEQELEPMPASERRIVHITLSSFDGVFTESVGEKNERRVVVRPAS